MAFQNTATEDTDEEDVQEIISQTSPIVQVFHLFYSSLSDMYLIFVSSYQIQCLPSKRARTTASPSQVTQLLFLFDPLLASDINFIIQQTSFVAQEPPIIPQDALPDSGVPALLLTSSHAPTTDEVLRQVRYFF